MKHVLDVRKVKLMADECGYKLKYVVRELGISRSMLNTYSYIKKDENNELIPVIEMKESFIIKLEEFFDCDRSTFLTILK